MEHELDMPTGREAMGPHETSETAQETSKGPEMPIGNPVPPAGVHRDGRPAPPAGVTVAAPENLPQGEPAQEDPGRPFFLRKMTRLARAAFFALRVFVVFLVSLIVNNGGLSPFHFGDAFFLICFLVFVGHLTGVLPKKSLKKLLKFVREHMLAGVFDAIHAFKQQPLQNAARILAVASTAASLFVIVQSVVLGISGIAKYRFTLPTLRPDPDVLAAFDWSFLLTYFTTPAFLIPQALLAASAACSLIPILRSLSSAKSNEDAKPSLVEQIGHADPFTQEDIKMLPTREALVALIAPLAMFVSLNMFPIVNCIQVFFQTLFNVIGGAIALIITAGLLLLFLWALTHARAGRDSSDVEDQKGSNDVGPKSTAMPTGKIPNVGRDDGRKTRRTFKVYRDQVVTVVPENLKESDLPFLDGLLSTSSKPWLMERRERLGSNAYDYKPLCPVEDKAKYTFIDQKTKKEFIP